MPHKHDLPEEQVTSQDIRRHLEEEHQDPRAWANGSFRSLVHLHRMKHHPDHEVIDTSLGTMAKRGE